MQRYLFTAVGLDRPQKRLRQQLQHAARTRVILLRILLLLALLPGVCDKLVDLLIFRGFLFRSERSTTPRQDLLH